MPLTPVQLQALSNAASAAHGAELETGCPADITIAQWALESGWGEHQPGNNCFGIKAIERDKIQVLMTGEVMGGKHVTVPQRFARFDSLQECFERHGELLTQAEPYIVAWRRFCSTGDFLAWVSAVAGKYATDPNYARKLMEVLTMPEVESALSAVEAA